MIIIFFLSYITWSLFPSSRKFPSSFWTIIYIYTSDGHDDICTCVVKIHKILDGLWWLNTFNLSLLLYKFGRTFLICIVWTQLLYVLVLCRFLLLWMTMSTYNFFLTNFSSFVSMLDSITSLLDSTSSLSLTHSLFEGGPICRVSMCFHPMITSQKFTNNSPCSDLVNKYATMCSVLE